MHNNRSFKIAHSFLCPFLLSEHTDRCSFCFLFPPVEVETIHFYRISVNYCVFGRHTVSQSLGQVQMWLASKPEL